MDNRSKTFKTAYKCYTGFVVLLAILCHISQFYKLYQLLTADNFIFDEVLRNYSITSIHFTSLIRCYILKGTVSEKIFRNIIKYEKKIYASKNKDVISVYNQMVSSVRKTTASYFAGILLVVVFYIAAPTFRDPYLIVKGNVTVQVRQVPLSSWTPFEDKYWPSFIWTGTVGAYLSAFFVSSDLTSFSFIIFGLCQIKILKHFIRNFQQYSEVVRKSHGLDITESHRILQKEIIKMHQEIIDYVNNVNDTLKNVMLLDFLQSSFQLAGLLFQIMINISIIQCILMGQFIGTLIARIYIYCSSSHSLNEQSQSISSVWYETDWTGFPKDVRKNIVMCMMRAQQPLRITIGSFYNITLATFLKILKGTYTYMMVLVQFQYLKQE